MKPRCLRGDTLTEQHQQRCQPLLKKIILCSQDEEMKGEMTFHLRELDGNGEQKREAACAAKWVKGESRQLPVGPTAPVESLGDWD